jgi:hypothetical protein
MTLLHIFFIYLVASRRLLSFKKKRKDNKIEQLKNYLLFHFRSLAFFSLFELQSVQIYNKLYKKSQKLILVYSVIDSVIIIIIFLHIIISFLPPFISFLSLPPIHPSIHFHPMSFLKSLYYFTQLSRKTTQPVKSEIGFVLILFLTLSKSGKKNIISFIIIVLIILR